MSCFAPFLKALRQSAVLEKETLEEMSKVKDIIMETTFDFDGFDNSFTMTDVLGAGSFGRVRRASRTFSGEDFAIKIMDKVDSQLKGQDAPDVISRMASREMNAMRRVADHPGIVTLHKAFPCEKDEQIFFVMELVEGPNLYTVLSSRLEPPREEDAVLIVQQLAEALSFCHRRGVAHRDVKPENVLVKDSDVDLVEEKDAEGKTIGWVTQERLSVKLCDFGSAYVRGTSQFSKQLPVGTPGYAAPEMFAQRPSDEDLSYDPFKADAYSFGMLIFALLCISSPPAASEGEFAHRQHSSWSKLSLGARSLIDALVVHDPSKRLSVSEVLNHPWVLGKASEQAKLGGA